MNKGRKGRPAANLSRRLLQLGALLLSGTLLGGCAVNPPEGDAPPGFPYPPEGLWRRIVEVIKTPPDELTYKKFGQIFGVEFDEDKIGWYGDKASRKDFLLMKSTIKNAEIFPFHKISLTQNYLGSSPGRVRRVAFDLDLIDPRVGHWALVEYSKKYCVKPKFQEIEAHGYRYDEAASTRPLPDGGPLPYRRRIYVGVEVIDPTKPNKRKEVQLRVLSNGCLVGAFYIDFPKL